MKEGYPPPWIYNMQRYGPPPSYPKLRIPGVNAPIPPGYVNNTITRNHITEHVAKFVCSLRFFISLSKKKYECLTLFLSV